jgi:hypothetical protein
MSPNFTNIWTGLEHVTNLDPWRRHPEVVGIVAILLSLVVWRLIKDVVNNKKAADDIGRSPDGARALVTGQATKASSPANRN